jgi:hypothetical protein
LTVDRRGRRQSRSMVGGLLREFATALLYPIYLNQTDLM